MVECTTGGGKIEFAIVPMAPPGSGVMYLDASAGIHASYLLRSDGKLDRTTGGGVVQKTMEALDGLSYVAVSCGEVATYALRSDGCVERMAGTGGKVTEVMVCNPLFQPAARICSIC